MLGEGASHRQDEVRVRPRRHLEEGLGLRDRVERVEHLNRHQHRESHGPRALVVEHLAAEVVGELDVHGSLEVQPQLLQRHHRPRRVPAVPPDIRPHRRHTHVGAGEEVAAEHPRVDQLLVAPPGGAVHDPGFSGVEGEGGRGEPVRHEVHPQQRHRRQHLREAEDDGEEDADNLSDVARDQVPDKRLGVSVDRAALLNSRDDGGEVVIRQHHLGRPLRDARPAPHRHPNVRGLERGRVVHPVARHGRGLARPALGHRLLQKLHNVLLVDRLGAGKEARAAHRHALLGKRHHRELLPGVRLAGGVLVGAEDADHAADRLGGLGVVPRDDHDADARFPAILDRALHLLAGGVEDPRQPHERQVRLHLQELVRVLEAGVGDGDLLVQHRVGEAAERELA
mmetsp:Transcript_48327/g.115008  ORF Transcript_48327/g.115008 Transcript_48327/m.115008 type:complete len:397 (+) Transcript_48327:380-1570(+)